MLHLDLLQVAFLSTLSLLAGDDPPDLVTAADLDAAVSRLKAEDTRLVALEQLIKLGSMEFYKHPSSFGSSGDEKRDVLIRKAAKYVVAAFDFPTVRRALESPRPELQYWALFVFPTDEEDQEGDPWMTLVPRVRDLARVGRDDVRGQAQEVLQRLGGHDDFLARCAETETELSNIMHLVGGDPSESGGFPTGLSQKRMRPHVLRLLRNPDENVRCRAMWDIGSNPNNAPMWRLEFNDEQFRRVLELSRSRSDKERAAAVSVLTAMRHLDPAALRDRMAQLVDDPSEDVRLRIPGALAGQTDRADVRALLTRLLRDHSASVRIFAILQLGPKNHVAELREMAVGKDSESAKMAAYQLKKLGLEKE